MRLRPPPVVVALALLATGAPARADEIDELRRELHLADVGRAVEAAQRLAEDRSPRALDAILDELTVGAPPRVQATLLDGVAGRKDARAVPVLLLYGRHLSPQLRKKAVVALAELDDKRVGPALVAALSDPARDVRASAARWLALRRDASAVEPLVLLLKRQDPAAPAALGALAGPDVARQLGELLGVIPDALLAQTLGEMLRRSDFGPDPIRVEVVQLVGKIPGMEATDVLKEYVTATEKEQALPSRAAAKKALRQRGG